MSGSSFLDALTDPGVDALLGATQGFAQAAMPTRMPTPWGAVLGMGAGGALQGAKSGQQMQLEQQQIQQAKMANQVAQSALPMALAKNQTLTNMWQHPDQMQQMINGGSTPTPLGAPPFNGSAPPISPTGAMVTGPSAPAGGPSAPNSPGGATKAPDIGSATTAALGSLPDDQTRSMAVNALLRSGLPQQAWAPWISSIQNESKWNLKAPDGSAGEIGPGQVKPDTGKMVGFSSDQLRDPQTNLVASAKYFGNQWQAGGGDPAAAMTGYNAGDVTAKPGDYAATGMTRLGQWGYPGAPSPVTAQSSAASAPVRIASNGPVHVPTGSQAPDAPYLQPGDRVPGTLAQTVPAATGGTAQPAQASGGPPAVMVPRSAPPQTGAPPGAPGTLSPSDALTTAQQYEQRANDLERQQAAAKFMQAQGMPAFAPAGDPAALRTAAQQYRTLALAGPTAAAQSQANLPAELAQKGFQQGPNGQMVPIPGGPADPAYVGQAKAAEAAADAAASRTRFITTRSGVVDPTQIDPDTGMAKEIYRQPEYHELQDQNGQEVPAFIAPGAGGKLTIYGGPQGGTVAPGGSQGGATGAPQGATPTGPQGTAPGTIPPSKIGPGQEEIIKHLADQYATEDKQKYEGATNSLFQLNQQDKNIAALNSGGGWSSTGSGANAKLEWAKDANSALQTLGIQPVVDPNKVSSWEDATKIQTQLAFAQAKQLGSREAQQVISMSRAATPGAENTPEGYRAISSGYHEMNNREVDLYNYKTDWLQSHGGNLTGAETAFNNQFTPQMYAQRAVSSIKPVTIGDPKQLGNYLPGTFVTDGKTISPTTGKPMIVQVPQRPGTPPVPDYLQPPGANNAP